MLTTEDSVATLPHLSYCRQKIFKEKALPDIENYMFENHDQLRQAATECMCNMVVNKEVRWARDEGGEQSPQGESSHRAGPGMRLGVTVVLR